MVQWDPQDYSRHSAAQLSWARELIARLDLKGSETLLDIGCGDGKITAEIAQHLPHGRAVGIDASPAMIAFARKTFPTAQHPNLEFHSMDAREIHLPLTFEIAFSNATLHWIDDQPAVLRGVHTALRPGGRFVISCGGRGNAGDVLALFDDIRREKPWSDSFRDFNFHYHFHGPEEYGAWLRQTGFQAARVALVEKDMVHDGPEGLAAWVRTTWHPYIEPLPEDRREAFIHEIVRRYLSTHPLDASGKSHVRMFRLEVDATRP